MDHITTTHAPHANALGEFLDQELGTLSGVKDAILLSSDALLHSRTQNLSQDEAERLAAMGAGFQAIAGQYNERSGGGGVRQVLVELENHLCMISQAGTNMRLLVETTGTDVDVATIAGQMAALPQRIAKELDLASRQTSGEPSR